MSSLQSLYKTVRIQQQGFTLVLYSLFPSGHPAILPPYTPAIFITVAKKGRPFDQAGKICLLPGKGLQNTGTGWNYFFQKVSADCYVGEQ
ncbi:MAG: hypothetical protein V1793_04425 [Pseudomonadota bacterium]